MNDDTPIVGTLVHEVAHMMRLDIDRRLKNHDLTRVKWVALQLIQAKPMLTQTELANELKLGAATVGRLIDRLEKRHLVQRLVDAKDRRARLLTITEKAESTLADLNTFPNELHEDLMGTMTSHELSSLRQGLTKLRNTLRSKLCLGPVGFSIFEACEDLGLLTVISITTAA
jgi:MarR family transcriptional regulator for hemolysin